MASMLAFAETNPQSHLESWQMSPADSDTGRLAPRFTGFRSLTDENFKNKNLKILL